MNELETYIRAHAAEFDTEVPAKGHERRFRSRIPSSRTPLASFQAAPSSFRANPSSFRAKTRNLLVPAFALAALAAVVLLVLRPGEPRDFRFVPDDPEAIFLAYMDQVASLYDAVPAGNSVAWDATMQEITEEGVPLFEQLPGELSRREQARILKAYYSELLEGARQLTKSTK